MLAIELRNITKRFPGVVANDRVDLSVERGEIHAIVGENGAGKSTLMKILYGMQKPDEGEMLIDGRPVVFDSPTDAINVGIGMVHQHFMLADNFSVLENVVLGSEPVGAFGQVKFDSAEARLLEVSESFGLTVDPGELVANLDVGERQRVEIIKVLFRGAEILILDEPTAVLVPQEVEQLHQNLFELKAQGATIVIINHKLPEVLAVADTITVLRQGKSVNRAKANEVSAAELAEMMVGSDLPSPTIEAATVGAEVSLALAGISVESDDRTVVRQVSLELHNGEILGIAGVEGNGQSELIEAVVGTLDIAEGSLQFMGEDITTWNVRQRREAGLAYIPQDRHEEGLLISSPLWENAALGRQTMAPYSKGVWMDREGSRAQTEQIVERFGVKTPSVEVSARALSGGNQQKLIIGREMMSDPKVLIAAHPTRGIDVGAQATVWQSIRDAKAQGLATLLVSADLDELIGLSDKIVVMLRGALVATLDPASITPRDLGSYMTGVITADSASSDQGSV